MAEKIKISFFMAIALTCLAIFFGCQPKDKFITSLKAGETGTFRFSTRDVEGFQDLMTGDNAYNAKGLGTLFLPSNASRENKVAVMVILHGSGGEWSGRGADQADFLVQHGVGAFRLTEILQLTTADIDFKNNTVELKTRKRKGGGYRRDKLYMSEILRECIKDRFDTIGDSSKYLFPHPDPKEGHYKKDHTIIKEMMGSLCAKAKVKKFTFYALRHYGALTLANSGKASLREIQHMLRHRRPTTTDNYLKGLKPELKTPAKILGDVLPKV